MNETLHLNFNPFPVLHTERLLLRQMAHSDVGSLFAMRSNAEAMRYIDRPLAIEENDALELLQLMEQGLNKNESITWAIAFQDKPGLIGTIGFWRMQPEHFRAEIGYILHPDHHRKGIMQEALQPTLDYAFKVMNLHSVEANINPANEGSVKLVEKNGFRREAHFRENYYFNGRFIDTYIYSLLNPYHAKNN